MINKTDYFTPNNATQHLQKWNQSTLEITVFDNVPLWRTLLGIRIIFAVHFGLNDTNNKKLNSLSSISHFYTVQTKL